MARRKTKKAKATGKRRGRPPGSKNSSGSAGLLSELVTYRRRLEDKHNALGDEIRAIAAAINAMQSVPFGAGRIMMSSSSSSVGARRGPRPPGTSLKDFIGKVLVGAGGAMKAKDITSGVISTGYKTSSANLSAQVSTALADMVRNKQVRKLGRGLYAG